MRIKSSTVSACSEIGVPCEELPGSTDIGFISVLPVSALLPDAIERYFLILGATLQL
jgi:hypothetical protein